MHMKLALIFLIGIADMGSESKSPIPMTNGAQFSASIAIASCAAKQPKSLIRASISIAPTKASIAAQHADLHFFPPPQNMTAIPAGPVFMNPSFKNMSGSKKISAFPFAVMKFSAAPATAIWATFFETRPIIYAIRLIQLPLTFKIVKLKILKNQYFNTKLTSPDQAAHFFRMTFFRQEGI